MEQRQVHIIGGGIIGICTAWYLNQAGHQVTIIDPGDFNEGTSFGNNGMIVPSHFMPLANPGTIKKGALWLFNSKSPFYIRPRWDMELFRWIWQFIQSAYSLDPSQNQLILFQLNAWSKQLFSELAQNPDLHFPYEEQGLLMVYQSEKQAEEEAKLAKKAKELGMNVELLDSKGLQEKDPNLSQCALGGLFFPADAHCAPHRLMTSLRQSLLKKGVNFLASTQIVSINSNAAKITSLIDQLGQSHPVDQVVIAAGAWSAILLQELGIRLPLQDGKGYSLTIDRPQFSPALPTILCEPKVALTPMGQQLRIGGTLELSGLSPKINLAKVKGILEGVHTFFPNIDLPDPHQTKIWKGYRPCSPDGLPYIGPADPYQNLWVGTGHGMMGLSLGPATGQLLAQMISNIPVTFNPMPFRLSRF